MGERGGTPPPPFKNFYKMFIFVFVCVLEPLFVGISRLKIP